MCQYKQQLVPIIGLRSLQLPVSVIKIVKGGDVGRKFQFYAQFIIKTNDTHFLDNL